MPTYEYACNHCEHRLEQFQSITAEPLRKCPACGKPALRRLIGTGGGVIFKGSGFYSTDYRSESYQKAAERESKPAGADAAKPAAAAPTDGKPVKDGTGSPAVAVDRDAQAAATVGRRAASPT